jgi:hypothetical protein
LHRRRSRRRYDLASRSLRLAQFDRNSLANFVAGVEKWAVYSVNNGRAHRPRRIGLLGWRRKRSSAARNAPPWLWIKRADIKRIFCSKLTTLLSIRPSNLRRARVLAHGATRHPITFASITPPIAELRHTPSLQWQRYGRRYVPLLSSHRSSRGRFVGGAPWSNSLKRYCRVAIVNIPGGTRCPPLRACGK